ncbi:hypothetical protein PV518_34105 [Streptomyces sp. ND04-05B]|uniref:hypothetical protein n=1 Tax=Streptomyces sp. ND04-05B TaxID=3028693 RepID=UPI0029BA6DE4|nr:hypothetical protein [Streptomyces sp. ND04-05B]MDX3067151.1 hypothetical protein [Streptomyces sp. ND04-05B]
MDPSIAAALITTPTTVLAAAAAYAAGRAQARSAHRGPVDAVRRQQQRDAYAELTRAARSYLASTETVKHLVQSVYSDAYFEADPDLSPRILETLHRPTVLRSDLADALSPDAVPPALDKAMERVERLSPTWQQDIRDANRVDDVVRAESVVAIEGPDHLAELAHHLGRRALDVQRCWARAAELLPFFTRSSSSDPEDTRFDMEAAIREFTHAARAHLNAH